MDILLFLLQVIIISLTGVLAPGPVTTAVIASGLKNRHAGALVAIGHGIIEFPLMLAVIGGLGFIFKTRIAIILIGLLGGIFLILLGIFTFRDADKTIDGAAAAGRGNPLVAGILLTAGNPFFLLWWATVGLGLAVNARDLGMLAFAGFVICHWLCDLVWLEILSWTSFKGANLLTPKKQRYILYFCGAVMILFGVKFIHGALTH